MKLYRQNIAFNFVGILIDYTAYINDGKSTLFVESICQDDFPSLSYFETFFNESVINFESLRVGLSGINDIFSMIFREVRANLAKVQRNKSNQLLKCLTK